MSRGRKKKYTVDNTKIRDIDVYDHKDKKRLNNPPVGYAQYDTAAESKATYRYDPHIDPSLQWAGKAERTSFEIPTVSLHIHETINPLSIISAVRNEKPEDPQISFFDTPGDIMKRRRETIEFYKHDTDWTNRLIAGDSLLVMNSLLQKEGMGGQVQMVYIDPPYGIKYGSNFQPFVNKRDVKDGKDEDLTQEPEMIKAFRDTWELGIHSYLTYLRDRLLLVRELLAESGSVFVQISDENVHLVRNIMDEVFGTGNFVSLICFNKTGGFASKTLANISDYLIWYSKSKEKLKYRALYTPKRPAKDEGQYCWVELSDLSVRPMTDEELNMPSLLPKNSRIFAHQGLASQGSSSTPPESIEFEGKQFKCPANSHWKTGPAGIELLKKANRLFVLGGSIRYKRYLDDFPVLPINNMWVDVGISGFGDKKQYIVQTNTKVVQRCILMTTDPGDLVLDITCGSGTTAYVAEQWGRRWVTCDTSRVAITLAKQRLMTAAFDYYRLAHPEQGVGSGFVYKTVPHITLKSIANNEPPATETLYDQPEIDKTKIRVTGPFTVEAVPSPVVKPLDEIGGYDDETAKQADWKDELYATGILGRNGQKIEFSRVETLSGTKYLQAEAETKEDTPRRAVICFGGETRPLDSRMVSLALDEAENLRPKPQIIIFAAFQFDPEAAKDIDETAWPGVMLLKVQMNTDLLTEDLKKKRASNQSFWLVGQPDVELIKIDRGADKGKYKVRVNGFDYYDVKKGEIISGNTHRIAMWMLDTDYNGMNLVPKQVFFPLSGASDGWNKLAKTLKAEINQELIEKYAGNESLPFTINFNTQIAVKIIDDRGIESLKVIKAGGY
ncbi:MAG: site-specific DNA-methyltransferase [Firmicutes bacterium]|nr:site-specific DNA-methyltransferase [Bacillota bacterium]